MARLVVRRSALAPLSGSAAIYAIGIALAGAAAFATEDTWFPLLFTFGGIAALFAWWTMRWPDQGARYLSFGAVLLLACIANRLLYLADVVLSGPRLDEWPFPAANPEYAFFKGEVLTVAGSLISVLAWAATGGLRVSPSVILSRLDRFRKQLLVIYVLSLIAVIAMQRLPDAAAAFGVLLPTLQALGLVAAVLLPLAALKRAIFSIPSVLLLLGPFVLASAGTGMKESIILALLPVGAILWARVRGFYSRTIIISAGVVCISLITSYVGYFRDAVWRDHLGTVTTAQVLEEYVDELQQVGAAETIADGWLKFVSRSNASISRAWAVAIADEQAMEPELVFGPLIYVFIPRVFWPDKPAIRQGWEFSRLVFGPAYTAWSESSTAAGFYTSLYLGYGWIAFLGGAVFVGYLVAKATLAAKFVGGDLAAGLFVLGMVPYALRIDEQWPVGVFSAPVITLAYVLVVVFAVRLITLRQP